MPKHVFFDDDARSRILDGAEILYRAVKSTMSPRGKNVIIKKPYGVTTTHDGVTVADSIIINEDSPEKLGWSVGADLIKEAANKLNNDVGDGTTSVTVLTYTLMRECHKLIAAGYNAMEVRQSLESAVKELLDELDKRVIEVDAAKVEQVAAISAGDPALGKLIADVANDVGKDGSITVEVGKGLEVTTEIRDGFTVNRGYLSPFFITDLARREAVLDKPAIIVSNRKLKTAADVQGLLSQLEGKQQRNIVVFADELSGEALNILVMNKTKGNLNIVVVKAAGYGDSRPFALADIAAVTGGTVVPEFDNSFEMGMADKVIVTKDRTTIIGSLKPADYIKSLQAQLAEQETEYDKEQLKKRIANIEGRVAVIKVGGASESEIDEKKYRIDDAVAAAKAALDGGIVAGGGLTLLELSRTLKSDDPARKALRHALEQPFRTIVENAGIPADKVIDTVKGNDGINVMTGQLTDLVEAGIVDPAKVTRTVLRSAISIAATALTVDTLVVDVPDEI